MATRQSFKPADSSGFANWKLWAKEIEDAFIAFGWTRTSDTGQIDWATLAAIPVNATPGYILLQMADSLASTCPCIVKLELGLGTTAGQGQVWVTLGTGSNGSGTLTGNTTTRRTIFAAAGFTNQGSTPREMNFSGTTSRFCCYIFRDAGPTVPAYFGIERSRDATGAETDEHVTFFFSNNQSAQGQQTILKPGGGASPGVESGILAMPLTTLSTSLFNNRFGVSPVCAYVGSYSNPMVGLVALKTGDVIDGAIITVPLYGTNRQMMVAKTNLFSASGVNMGLGGAGAIAWF